MGYSSSDNNSSGSEIPYYFYNESSDSNVSYADHYYYYNDEVDIEILAKEVFSQPDQIIAFLLGFAAIVLNVLTLTALSKTRGRLTTHFRFMISLAISDIIIGFTVLAFVVNAVINPKYYPGNGPEHKRLPSMCGFLVIKALNSVGLNICLLNLLGMAVDHYVAIKQPLHYTQTLSKQRSNILILILWIIATFCGFSDFITGFFVYPRLKHKYNFCEVVHITKYGEEYTIFGTASVTACIMIFVYAKIYITVRSHRIPGEQTQSMSSCSKNKNDSSEQGCSRSGSGSFRRRLRRSNRALKTTLLIVVTFLLCWLPTCIFQVALIIQIKHDPDKLSSPKIQNILIMIDKYLVDILVLNSILDPIIYTVRLAEVQLGYKRMLNSMIICPTLRKLFGIPHNSNTSASFYRDRSNTFHNNIAGGGVINNSDHSTSVNNRFKICVSAINTDCNVEKVSLTSSNHLSHNSRGNSSQGSSSGSNSHGSHDSQKNSNKKSSVKSGKFSLIKGENGKKPSLKTDDERYC